MIESHFFQAATTLSFSGEEVKVLKEIPFTGFSCCFVGLLIHIPPDMECSKPLHIKVLLNAFKLYYILHITSRIKSLITRTTKEDPRAESSSCTVS